MWDTERFMQVHVQYIRTNFRRLHNTNLSVHISTVHIDLAAVLMDKITDITDTGFKDTMSGWISHHQRAELLAIGFTLSF